MKFRECKLVSMDSDITLFLLRDSVNQQNAASGPCVHRHVGIAWSAVVNDVNGREGNSSSFLSLTLLTQISIP